jgi:predicted ester cyclase
MSTANETLVRRYFEDALSHADWDLLEALVAANYVDHEVVPNIPPTRAGLKQKYELLRSGCPDLRFVVEDLVSAGDRVAARVTVRGAHTQSFLGRAPTGRQMAAGKYSIFRVANGQLAEHWGLFDQLAMMAQLGA